MIKKIFIFIILLNLLPLRVFGLSYVVMEEISGRILESSNMNSKDLIASTTKIMTT